MMRQNQSMHRRLDELQRAIQNDQARKSFDPEEHISGAMIPAEEIIQYIDSRIEQYRMELHEKLAEQEMKMNQYSYTPTPSDKIERYLHMLYEAQKSGHEVHNEIDAALKLYRTEIGI